MGGGGGILCPVYCGRSDASGEGRQPRTVYVPVPYLPSPAPHGQFYQCSDPALGYGRPKYTPGTGCVYRPSVSAPADQPSPSQHIVPAGGVQGSSPLPEHFRLHVPSLRPGQRHSKSFGVLDSSFSKTYGADLKDREDAVLAALLNKEAELQERIINKQRQLQDLRRQLQEVSSDNGHHPRRTNTETSRELQQLRNNLCEKEAELEQCRAEMDLMKKEATSLTGGQRVLKDACTSQLASGDPERPLPAVRALREREEENRLLSRRLEALRDERRDLRELLVQKEQQLATALGSVNPACKESSAVQLGMQAISMVQNNAGLKKQIQQLQAELTATREDHARKELLLEDTLQKLNEKRKEAAGLLEIVSQRDMKIARVETFLQHRTRELEQLQEKSRLAREQEALRLEKAAEELRILEDQQSALKSIIASRDEKMLCLQNELVRRDAIIRQLEERSRTLAHDLEQSGNHVQQLIRSSAAKDAYLYELEAQLRHNEVQRQASYLAEVARTRHFALETRLKEEECRAALNEKNEELAAAQHDLSRRCNTLQQIRQAVGSIEAADKCYRVSPLSQRASPTAKKDRGVSLPSCSQTGGESGCAGVSTLCPTAAPLTLPQRPLQDSLKALKADFLLDRSGCCNSVPIKGAATSALGLYKGSVPCPRGRAGTGEESPEVGANDPVTSAPPVPTSYTALPGDPVDEAVSAVLRDSRYMPYIPVVRRLSPGKYAIGTQQVQLDVHPAHGVLVQSSERPRAWMPFVSFLEGLSFPEMLPSPHASVVKTNIHSTLKEASTMAATKTKGAAWAPKALLRPATLKSKTSAPART